MHDRETFDDTGLYLRMIAKTPLLNPECERVVAEKICQTRRALLLKIMANDYALKIVRAAVRKAAAHKLRIDYVIDVQGIDVAARKAAFQRLDAGGRLLQRALAKNRRDLKIATDRRQSVERRKAARLSLARRRRAAARRLLALGFQAALLKKPLAGLSRLAAQIRERAARPTSVQIANDGLAPHAPDRRELRRLVRMAGESPRRLSQRLAAVEELRRGHHAACQALMMPNLRLVVSIARQYTLGQDDMLELIQEGNVGLMRAIDKFDPLRGHRFSTCAWWWVRQAIRRYLAQHRNGFRTSYVMTRKLDRIQRATQAHLQSRGRIPCLEDLAQAAGVAPRETETLLRMARTPQSIDVGHQEGSLANVIADTRQPCCDEQLDQDCLQARVEEVLGDLEIRERQVLRMRYGLQGELPLSLADIGKLLRLSKERIRQIEEAAMAKLRHPRRAARFVQFFSLPPDGLLTAAAALGRHE